MFDDLFAKLPPDEKKRIEKMIEVVGRNIFREIAEEMIVVGSVDQDQMDDITDFHA